MVTEANASSVTVQSVKARTLERIRKKSEERREKERKGEKRRERIRKGLEKG